MLYLVTHNENILFGPVPERIQAEDWLFERRSFYASREDKPHIEEIELGYRAEKIICAILAQIEDLKDQVKTLAYHTDNSDVI